MRRARTERRSRSAAALRRGFLAKRVSKLAGCILCHAARESLALLACWRPFDRARIGNLDEFWYGLCASCAAAGLQQLAEPVEDAILREFQEAS